MLEGLIDDITAVKSPWGVILLILNIIWPGIGSIINGLMNERCHGTTVIVGIL